VQVKAFQDLVDNVYKDSLNTDPRFVTIEGWKFLYWNAKYILDRLPEIPINLPPGIEVINPAMSLVNPGSFTMEVKGTGFTANSIVYFNGSARATTFISDSLLNAQIFSTDVSAAGNYPVWVSDGTANSDTLVYKVVSTLPQPVRPVLECVRNNGDGTYTAFFGYKNDNNVSVYIPAGSKNKFTPTPQDRGQPRVFESGRHYKVFTVNFNGSNLVWT
jgi:IPT/TIG domain.